MSVGKTPQTPISDCFFFRWNGGGKLGNFDKLRKPRRNLGDGRGEVEWTQTEFGVRGDGIVGKLQQPPKISSLFFRREQG